jgi:hypothetical protein
VAEGRAAAADSPDGSRSSDEPGRGATRTGRDAARHDGHDRSRAPRQDDDGRLTAARAAQLGLQQISEVTGRQVDGVCAVEPSDDGWAVGVEVVEDRRIPSSTDVLAIYQADLDQSGELISYRRIKRYKRGQTDSDYGDESW